MIREYKGYKAITEYSEEDNAMVGRVVGLKNARISFHGETTEELMQNFRDVVDNYLDTCREAGIEPEICCDQVTS